MPALDNTYTSLLYASNAAFTAKGTFTTEVTINDETGGGQAFFLPAGFFKPPTVNYGFKVIARGILSSTGTPTYTFSLRGGTKANTSAAILLGSAALTTGSGVTNKGWEFEGDIIVRTNAASGANSTIYGQGVIASPAGLASPFAYDLFGGAAQPGTAATFDTSIANYINFNVACSASSSSNTITLLSLIVLALN